MVKEFEKKNPVPVIIVRGSGRAADVLAYAVRSVIFVKVLKFQGCIDKQYILIYTCISIHIITCKYVNTL